MWGNLLQPTNKQASKQHKQLTPQSIAWPRHLGELTKGQIFFFVCALKKKQPRNVAMEEKGGSWPSPSILKHSSNKQVECVQSDYSNPNVKTVRNYCELLDPNQVNHHKKKQKKRGKKKHPPTHSRPPKGPDTRKDHWQQSTNHLSGDECHLA